jgi:hypothetical protein
MDDLKKQLRRTDEQAQIIRDLRQEKGVSEDELKGIMCEFADSIDNLSAADANKVIETLSRLGDARE